MQGTNNDDRLRRLLDYLRKLARRHRRSVQEQLVRGAAYGAGIQVFDSLTHWFHHWH